MRYFKYLCGVIIFLLNIGQALHAATLPDGFIELLVAENLDPTKMVIVPDGRIFIAEKNGKILLVKNDILQSDLFLDIDVDNFNERGLSGFALDPDYEINNHFYVYYTVAGINKNRLSRFTANGDSALPNSEVVIMEFDQLCSTVHNGGEMHFGPDRKLYVAIGDGTCSSRVQDLDNFFGKMIRINTDGSIPEDNPFYNELEGDLRAIYAYGFRNPFTFDINPLNGKILLNDVGSDKWEEVNEVIPGGNYGWALNEGASTTDNPDNYVAPLYAYDHNSGCAVVGGSFYQPELQRFPDQYMGKYFFGDYCRGYIKVLNPDSGNIEETFATDVDRLVSLVTSPNGSIYYIERAGIGDGTMQDNTSSTNGRLWKVSYTGSGAPFISVQPKSQLIPVSESVEFSVQAVGPDLTYQWFENENEIIGKNSRFLNLTDVQLEQDGNKYWCRITNDIDQIETTQAVLSVTPNQRPQATITSPLASLNYKGGDLIEFSGVASDIEDGTLTDASLKWYIDFHHDEHTHPALELITGSMGSFVVPTVGETSPNVYYRIHLIATDSDGLSGTTYIDILPKKTTINITSQPSGIPIRVDGKLEETPYSYIGVEGINRYVQAPPFIETEEGVLVFREWNNGTTQPIYFFEVPEEDLKLNFTLDEQPIGTGRGLLGEYFQRKEEEEDGVWSFLGEPDMIRTDTMIDFMWGGGSPGGIIAEDKFTVRWTGYVEPIYSDIYTFAAFTDDGVRVWVDDQLIIDQWVNQGPTFVSGDYYMELGKRYPIKMEYYEDGGGATAQLYWKTQSLNTELIPQAQLYPDAIFERIPELTKDLHIYPMPAQDLLKVLFNSTDIESGNYWITDMSGALWKESSYTKQRGKLLIDIDISNLPPGIYFISIDEGGMPVNYKFIKI